MMEMAERMGYIYIYISSFFHYFTRSISHFLPSLYLLYSSSNFSVVHVVKNFLRRIESYFSLSSETIHQFSTEGTTPDRVPSSFFLFPPPPSSSYLYNRQPLVGFGIFIFLEIPAGKRFRRDFVLLNSYFPRSSREIDQPA